MRRFFYYCKVLVFLMTPIAVGFFLYGFFVLSNQSATAKAEGVTATNYVTLNPAIEAFTQGDEVVVNQETEIITTLHVFYKAHGTPNMQTVSAYDIRDKALLWRHEISGGVISGMVLQANGALNVCGFLLDTPQTPFCLTLSDNGTYPIEGIIAVDELDAYIASEKKAVALREQIIAADAVRMQKEQERIKLEQSVRYKLQKDETYKASTTTLADLFNAHKVAIENMANTNRTDDLLVQHGMQCDYKIDAMCAAELAGQAVITSEQLPQKFTDVNEISIAELEYFVETQLAATNTLEAVSPEEELPIEGADGIFDYDDVVDYRTCFHMCYYVEGSSWKKCTKNCNDKF